MEAEKKWGKCVLLVEQDKGCTVLCSGFAKFRRTFAAFLPLTSIRRDLLHSAVDRASGSADPKPKFPVRDRAAKVLWTVVEGALGIALIVSVARIFRLRFQ